MSAPKNPDKPSSRHVVVDARFAALLAEDFGIARNTILDALEGEPQKQAISVCGWAEKTADPGHALLCWSKKHRRGRHRTDRRDHRQSAARERQDGPREQQDERRRGTAPARRRGVSGGLDAACIRANVERMSL
ncbi:MAG: hypothetical protein M3Q49_01300 [Actinomycetota bacterium]|nr:hypothetical protein [Actinomycetota bacterium]MDP9484428.1 hypothetical protein [Actinomycetota bacterium]